MKQTELTDADRLQRISGAEATADDWRWAAHKIADKRQRTEVRTSILSREKYPRKELVALLSDSQLAVRLGVLELLEEAAGDTYGLNAWASPSGKGSDPRNEHALKLWNAWAGNSGKVNVAGPVLSDEQMQSYIRDVISGNTDRKRRAVRMLEPHGMKGVAGIQDFLIGSPALPDSSTISLKEAQYHLVLSRTAGENAAVLARDLTVGNRDQKLGAIAALKKSGFLAIPIARDFLGSDDALVRETAVDTILTLGGAQTVPLVKPYLKEEKDVNVIHAAMRRFREIGGNEVTEIVAGYLSYEDEDLVVAAVQSLTKLSGSSDSYGSDEARGKIKPEWEEAIVKLLDDARWRIRSTALEFVAARRTASAGDKVVDLLSDKDEFVRAQAIKAAVALRLQKAKDKLETMFLTDDEMVAPATEALTGMRILLSDKLIAHLDTRESDVIIRAIRAVDYDKQPWLKIVARYATNKDLDVACAALRSLGNEEDKLKFEFVANHLTSALQSGQSEKMAAVLDGLDLPTLSRTVDPALMRILQSNSPSGKTTLDPLYDAFLKPLEKQKEADAVAVETGKVLAPNKEATAKGGMKALTAALAKVANDMSNPQQAFRAALLLAKAGDDRGIVKLAERIERLSTSERAAIADGLYYPRTAAAVPLIRTLMQDVVPDVRKEAATKAFNEAKNSALIQMGLKQLEIADTKIQASEMYGYNLERVAQDSQSKRVVRNWASRMLASEDSEDASKVLALILMRSAMSYSDTSLLEPFTKSSDQWIRRAAWYSLGKSRASWLGENVETLMADPSPRVREVLPWALTTAPGNWTHYFSDNQNQRDQSYSYSSSGRRPSLNSKQEAALQKLAENDPSAEVRFESWFCLLSYGKPIDLNAFIGLLPDQPKKSKVADRIANHIEKSYRSMGTGMKPLLAYANMKEISKTKLPAVLNHFTRGDKGSTFSSFGALAKATESTGQPQHVETDDDPAAMMEKRKRLLVVVFHKSGCKECEKVDKYLADMKRDFPLLEIQKRNISDQTDILVNRALCDRFQISGAGKTPALFTQAGAAIAPNTKPDMIAELLQSTMELPDDSEWSEFGSEEMEDAKRKVEETFSNLTLPIVIGAGLLDGINPCAFATIIFFLSYLQVARRTPKEILMVGGAFILAIFLSYFAVGLIFHSLVEKLTQLDSFQWIRSAMTYVFAAFALIVAILSLRDALRARKGNLQDMTLQLPTFLKNRIRTVIRKGAKARNFVLAAFVSGVLISFLELACTGQVYAPIIFQIQQGSGDAVFYLLLYNLAFILPLVVIFILAYRGMTSAALIDFQKKHTAVVKIATAVLFLILAAVILYGDKILPH